MRFRRIARIMAGDVKSPGERYIDRMDRRAKRELGDLRRMMEFVDKIARRQQGDPGLPPMPYDFKEQQRRNREKT